MKRILMQSKTQMEYVKGDPYFCQAEKIKSYPYLNRDLHTDILVIGGGIVGAIANFYLSQKYDVSLVDKSRFGHGCTSCATVLLEYQLDDYAEDLLKTITEEQIVSVYKMGLKSIEKIADFIKKYGNHCHFSKRPSLMYTNKIFGVKALEKEYDFRVKHGFKAKLFNAENSPFSFPIKAGLYCEDGGAEFNPYLFAKQMIENASNQDHLFENTQIDSISEDEDGFIATTNFHEKIYCKKIIFATGYNFELLKNTDLCDRTISYTIVTKPVENIQVLNNTLLQDDEEPYHYMRLLPDNRIIFGGEDTPFKKKKICDKFAKKKYQKLYKDLIKLFPTLADQIEVEYKFCGAFGATENNLGLIGETENKNIYYFISCGANGVINAMFGSELLLDIFESKENNLAPLFSPLRK